MNTYKRNKAKAVFINTEPTKTDQSQAHDTNINVIVKRYGVTNSAPGAKDQPKYGDFTDIPHNLRDMLEQARGVSLLRRKLPPALAELPIEQLLGMTPQQVNDILKPQEPPKEPTT